MIEMGDDLNHAMIGTPPRRAEAASGIRRVKSSSTKTHVSCGF